MAYYHYIWRTVKTIKFNLYFTFSYIYFWNSTINFSTCYWIITPKQIKCTTTICILITIQLVPLFIHLLLTYQASYHLLNPSLPNSEAYTQLADIKVLILNTFVVLAKALVQPRSEMRVPTIVCKLTVTSKWTKLKL